MSVRLGIGLGGKAKSINVDMERKRGGQKRENSCL